MSDFLPHQLGDAPFSAPGAWGGETDSGIGGVDYGQPLSDRIYTSVGRDACRRRRHCFDWTVVGPVAARGTRWEFK